MPGDLVVVGEGDRVPADARIVDAPLTRGRRVGAHGRVASGREARRRGVGRLSARRAGVDGVRGHGRHPWHGRGRSSPRRRRRRSSARSRCSPPRAKPPPTPLDARLGRLARQMVVVGVAITLALGGVMLLRGEPLHTAFLTSRRGCRRRRPGGTRRHRHCCARARRTGDGAARRDRAPARRDRDARRDDGHLHRQDRHPDREPHSRRGSPPRVRAVDERDAARGGRARLDAPTRSTASCAATRSRRRSLLAALERGPRRSEIAAGRARARAPVRLRPHAG